MVLAWLAQRRKADKLTELGVKVVHVGNAPGNGSGKTQVYQLPAGKEKTATNKFKRLYGSVSSDSSKYNLNVDAHNSSLLWELAHNLYNR